MAEDATNKNPHDIVVLNDGLLAEEYDPASGRLLGNFPQAFTHVSLVNAGRNLKEELVH